MRRKLFTVAAALSAVLCVCTCVLWARSYVVRDWVRFQRGTVADGHASWAYDRVGYESHSSHGRLLLLSFREACGFQPGFEPPDLRWRPAEPSWTYRADPILDRPFRGRGQGGAGRFGAAYEGTVVDLHHGWLALALLTPPAAWAVIRHRRRLRPPGLCPACGYDMRATPQAGGALLSRCPECGAVPAAP